MADSRLDGLFISGFAGSLAKTSETTPQFPGQLGKVTGIRAGAGKATQFYQYVKRYLTDSATVAAGDLAYWQDVDDFVVSAESTDAVGGTTDPLVAGIFVGAAVPVKGEYGYIQVGGRADAMVTDTGTAGGYLVPGSNTQLKAVATITTEGASAPQIPRVAIALEAFETITDTTKSVQLIVFRNGW